MKTWMPLLTCLLLLAGCRSLSESAHTTDQTVGVPQGNGRTIVGSVVKVDKDGNLFTNIPFIWMAAKPSNKDLVSGETGVVAERSSLLISIGGTNIAGEFHCIRAGDPGTWVVSPGPAETLRIDLKKGNAATAVGAAIGTTVRLTKVPDPN